MRRGAKNKRDLRVLCPFSRNGGFHFARHEFRSI
jgi:hypothetical protein